MAYLHRLLIYFGAYWVSQSSSAGEGSVAVVVSMHQTYYNVSDILQIHNGSDGNCSPVGGLWLSVAPEP